MSLFRRLPAALVITLAVAGVALPALSDDLVTECDRLAASPDDETRPAGVTGVAPEDIDTDRALPACTEAYEQSGRAPRFSFTLARVLYKKGETDRAQALFAQAAEAGHPAAMVNTGYLIEKDKPIDALAWYRKAAEAGNALGQFNLGVAHENGIGTAVDGKQALVWYQKAADQGYGMAVYNMAVLSDSAKFGPRNVGEAVRLYERAGALGIVNAMFNLGYMYENADGVEKDLKRAVDYYRMAADKGDQEARAALQRLGG